MAATAEELKELATLARESGDIELETKALEQLISLQSQTAPDVGLGGALEAAGAVGSGIVAQPVSGLAGILAEGLRAAGVDVPEGADVVKAVQEQLTFQPRSPEGQQALQNVGEAVQEGLEIARVPAAGIGGLATLAATQDPAQAAQIVQDIRSEGIGKTAGEATFRATGNPELSTFVEILPDAAMSATGLPIANRAAQSIPQSSKKREIGRKLLAGQTTEDTAGYRLIDPVARDLSYSANPEQAIEGISNPIRDFQSSKPKVQKFKDAARLKKSGFEDSNIAAWQQFTPEESSIASAMTKIKRASKQNDNVFDDPLEEVGKAAFKPIEVLLREKNAAGRQVRKSLNAMKNEPVEYNAALTDWMDDLKNQKINVNLSLPNINRPPGKNNPVSFDVDLNRSKFVEDPTTQKLLNTVLNRVAEIANKNGSFRSASAEELHDLKKMIDYRVEYGKSQERTLSNDAENLIKSLRSDVNDALRRKSKAYEDANDRFSKAIRPLTELNKATGRSFDLFDESDVNPKAMGLQLRKLITNYGNAPGMAKALEDVSNAAKDKGYDKNVNLARLVAFNNNMNKKFGVSANKGGTMQGIMQGAQNIDPTLAALSLADKAIEKASKVDDSTTFENMIRLFDGKSKKRAK